MHSEMWWPRLFRHHGEIAWDDYEKDYSDLPREVLLPHRVAEVARDAVKYLEAADKDTRDILQVPTQISFYGAPQICACVSIRSQAHTFFSVPAGQKERLGPFHFCHFSALQVHDLHYPRQPL